MEAITVKEILQACSGRLLRGKDQIQVRGVFTDSRLVEAEWAFFALKGERVDGHDYLGQALENGANLLLVEKMPDRFELVEAMLDGAGRDVALVLVENTETALGDLARYYLEKFQIKKVAVTGSTGKTTTKEMLAHILSKKYKTLSNQGNYNNLIGLPLTVFRLDSSYEALVLEMGMDRLGEIHRMAEIVKPHVAMVTNVGLSHLSRLESRENILQAKGEIRDFLTAGDLLIINGEDEMMKAWVEDRSEAEAGVGNDDSYELVAVGLAKAGSAGGSAGPEVGGSVGRSYVSDIVDLGEAGVEFSYAAGTIQTDQAAGINQDGQADSKTKIRLHVPGVHNVMNAGLAITAALKLGVDIESARQALLDFEASDMRLKIIDCGDVKIIDDSYNASPDSVRAAIDVLASVEGSRKIAILGDMFELGPKSAEYHGEIGAYAFQKGLDVLLSVGENAKEIVRAAKEKSMNAVHFHNKEMLITVLSQWIRKGDIVLVKGSRGMAMEEIVEAIKTMKIDL